MPLREDKLHEEFIQKLREKIPNNAKLTNTLASILFIEKEAVYRRLRGEVPFSFSEVIAISRNLRLSVDDLIDPKTSIDRPFHLQLVEYDNPMEIDFEVLELLARKFMDMEDDPHSMICSAMNMLPTILYLNYPYITRFYMFKWRYLYETGSSIKSYCEAEIPADLAIRHQKFIQEARRIKNICYILDYMFIQYLINDIKYFASIKLIKPESLERIKEDLLAFIDDFGTLAASGEFGPGQKVNIFISNINFSTTYSYVESHNLQMSVVKAFDMSSITSYDKKSFEQMKRWMQSLKRVSTLISESGERERIIFLEHQKDIIRTLGTAPYKM